MNIRKSIKNLNKYEIALWLGSMILLLTAFMINPNKDVLNFAATLIGVTSLILNAKGDALGQVLIVLWVLATIENPVYYTMILCFVIFLVNDLYGFYSWKKMRLQQEEDV